MNEQNLIPKTTLSKEEAKKLGSKGGKASVAARREKNFLSEKYAKYLERRYDVKINGEVKNITGEEHIFLVIDKVLAGGGSAAVSMLKEIRQATQGDKITVSGAIVSASLPDSAIDALPPDVKASLAQVYAEIVINGTK
jgi:hypothetical protein